MLKSTIKRYYQNVSLLKAYTKLDFMKQLVSFPVDYYLRGGRSSFPLNITLALTLRCNAKCSMCALSGSINRSDIELSLSQYKGFIDTYAKMKPGFVLYGGEPFLRRDILDIIAAIKKHRLSCGVFTNGLLLSRDILEEIIDLKVNFIAFSLYGPRKIHDRITGVSGAYDKIMESLSFLKKYRKNTRVIVHCTISEHNIEHLDRIADIQLSDEVRFGHLTFFTDKDKNNSLLGLKHDFPGGQVYLDSHIFNPGEDKQNQFAAYLRKLKGKRTVPFTPELSMEEITNWYGSDFRTKRKCFFIWRGVFIGPNGDVYPCMGNFYYKMGNILEEDFLEIWNNDKFVQFRSRIKKGLLSACSRCCRL